jgi:hypothetical protein
MELMIRFGLWFAAVGIVAAGARTIPAWHAAELGHSQVAIWTAPQTLVYRDSGSFRAAWVQLFPVAGLRPAMPAIDFGTWRVIIASVGTKPTGGYYLSLERGQVVRDSALLTVIVHTPPRNCGVTEELTQPAIAIATPIAPIPFRIAFHESAGRARCN